jgi:hypothetical protein
MIIKLIYHAIEALNEFTGFEVILHREHPNLVLSNNTQVFLRDISHNGDE